MSEFTGVIVRGDRVTFVCCDCGRFIKHGDQRARVVPQFGEPHEPEFEFVHANGCPPKKSSVTVAPKPETK